MGAPYHHLHRYLDDSAGRGDTSAVEDPDGPSLTYSELDTLTALLRDHLRDLGVEPGDRVGFYLRKSVDSIASIYGILRTGAAYVPVDPGAPASRNAYIFGNCEVAAIIVEEAFARGLRSALEEQGQVPPLLVLRQEDGPVPLRGALERRGTVPVTATHVSAPDDLAYILYTSGSTGKPKGVMLSHRNAVSFVEWCAETFEPTAEDRFSSHAPLHFDLSILDVHLSMRHGATLVLVGEEVGKDPHALAPLIAEQRISIWYSAPSILALLAQFGKLERHDHSALRTVLFAGEVFPVKHLRALKELWPEPRYFNLYGPTETNVCTCHEIPETVPEDRTQPYPIGHTCSHLESLVIDADGREVPPGEEGELCIRGPGVTRGYWNLPEQNATAFHTDAEGGVWYRTGDLVVDAGGEEGYIFRGRRDRMVKKRGYRIELGEIESHLYDHPAVKEAGVVAQQDDDGGVRIKAFLGIGDADKPGVIAMKAFCSERLPLYMIPDVFQFAEALPRTSTDKVDYQKLKEMG